MRLFYMQKHFDSFLTLGVLSFFSFWTGSLTSGTGVSLALSETGGASSATFVLLESPRPWWYTLRSLAKFSPWVLAISNSFLLGNREPSPFAVNINMVSTLEDEQGNNPTYQLYQHHKLIHQWLHCYQTNLRWQNPKEHSWDRDGQSRSIKYMRLFLDHRVEKLWKRMCLRIFQKGRLMTKESQ